MATKEKKEKKSKTSRSEPKTENPEKTIEIEKVESTEAAEMAESEAAASSSKRKIELEEIEVDVDAPEPPSKRAKRALKKGKSLPSKQDSDDEKKGDKDGKDKKAVRSEHSVWIGNLPFHVTAMELRKWLVDNSGGVITEEMITRVKLPTNKEPGRDKSVKPANKGFAYVDFTEIGPKVSAISLTESDLGGRKLLIKDATSFEGRPKKEPESTEENANEGKTSKEQKQDVNASRKIFVGNMSFKTTEDDLYRNFEKCGEIEWAKVATFEDTGKCKGFGWVKFQDPNAAAWAVKGFVKIKEAVETEDDFKDEEEKDKSQQKQFKTRKWWVNRMLGRELKVELAEDDQVRYKKRFGKDRKALPDKDSNPRGRPPPRKYDQTNGAVRESNDAHGEVAKPLKEAEDISVARLTGAVVKHTDPEAWCNFPAFTYQRSRLDEALAQFRSSNSSSSISFKLHFASYQPNPNRPETIPDRAAYALHKKHNDNPEAQKIFEEHMLSLAQPLKLPIAFTGPTGNSFPGHRVIQQVQESQGAEVANRLVDAVFRLYFAEGRHPGTDDMLVEACVEAGIDEGVAKSLVEDKSRGERDTKEKIRSTGMDIDAVPTVVIEGRRRDLTLTGLKEVSEYIKAMETISKESS
ncbi:hypothetical protein FOXB_02409 [Fusarium oxysporum f. sp. conglutinans Fo5176]|uniref:RRM domain-containing protein n=1 Tax=Fusarium oxysporum (strain Fo5176) TaxID=660025 RepID=F9F7N4_FUSOF|nr:hypothetical protein FOXB_02409 [Fusarium oxysporum f. sp. conglutinans Fo5176]